ncbi:T9SS type A sorting domain-containing protein [Dyadobacter diqingensis]|uniref:T9SS type A sorting domain-containing protein n=1 Tax=Dyadobacter diqingensis TaxID=2938121 RepID=UPI0020C234B6|nr:T9SS type A sorting domain-containing protein [Dyadobacter diqingensis]
MKIKSLLMVTTMFLGIKTSYAQDPAILSPNVSPSPGLVNGPVSASVRFVNSSTKPIPGDVNNPTYLSFTLVKITPTLVNGIPTVSGAGAIYFDWSATLEANGTWTILGIQNQTIPGQPDPFLDPFGGPVVIPGTINAASTSADAAANNGDGFNANVIPAAGFDVNNNDNSNNQAIYGYTDGVLPVKLLDFDAREENNTVNLAWSTTEETNSDRFEVQHSTNAKNWAEIGKVASNGESSVKRIYNYNHQSPSNGLNYYRLKMVDKDGTFAYSRIESINIKSIAITAYPNPASEVLFLSEPSITNGKSIKLISANGNTTYHSSTIPKSGISVKGFTNGIYILEITRNDGTISTQKVDIINK